jgi:hypothetical protein
MTVPPGIERPAGKVTVEPPGVAVGAPEPPQVEATLGVSAITKPLGKLSVKSDSRVARELVLVNVIVRVEIPPGLMVAGLKILLTPTPRPVGTPHAVASTLLLISVTAPFRAKSLPETLAPLFRLILSSAMITPLNEVVVSRVAELVTCQKMLQSPPVPTTDEPGPVVSALPILKTHTSVARPFRVSTPDNPTVDE